MLNSETAGEDAAAAAVCHGSPATSKAKPHSPGHKQEIGIPRRHGLISQNFYSFIYLFCCRRCCCFRGARLSTLRYQGGCLVGDTMKNPDTSEEKPPTRGATLKAAARKLFTEAGNSPGKKCLSP